MPPEDTVTNTNPAPATEPVPPVVETTPATPTPEPVSTPQPAETPVATTPEAVVPPPVETTPPITTVAPVEPEKPAKKSGAGLKLGILGLVIFLLISLVFGASYLVAAEKIDINNPQLQQTISKAVFALPFVPKTNKYLLTEAVSAHEKLSRNSFDLSMAVTSNNFSMLLGSNTTDIKLTGYTDYSEPKNPKFNMNLTVGKLFKGQIIKPDTTVYVKVDQLPTSLMSLLGVSPKIDEMIKENWISYDTAPLETQARKTLEENTSSTGSKTNEIYMNIVRVVLNEEVLPLVTQTQEDLDGLATYKLTLAPTDEQLDKIEAAIRTEISKVETNTQAKTDGSKMSDYIKNLKLTLHIDQKTHYLLSGSLYFDYDVSKSNTSSITSAYTTMLNQPTNVAIVLMMSDFGKQLPIDAPTNSITYEELTSRIQAAIQAAKQEATEPAEMETSSMNYFMTNSYDSKDLSF